LRYITNSQGQRTAVVIDLETWKQIVEALEDMEDAEELRSAREEDDEAIPWPQVKKEYQNG
jgi:PHD/YefM family antitoxin component YafN of YafNO toxin-antitoxin module